MLVLSRRPGEKILFPTLNTTVEVVSVRPGVVRLGIGAPPEVTVLREEVWRRDGQQNSPVQPALPPWLRELNHLLRNRLNTTNIGLSLLRRQIDEGMLRAAQSTLQMLEKNLAGLGQQAEQALERSCERPARPRPRALVVEDDQNERELLAGLLRLAGMEVITAGDGVDALDYLRQQGRPDMVLLDMILPRCDGPTTLRAIRHDPAYAGLKVYALSGHGPERFGLAQGEAGFDRWYRKPVNPEAMLQDLSHELTSAGRG